RTSHLNHRGDDFRLDIPYSCVPGRPRPFLNWPFFLSASVETDSMRGRASSFHPPSRNSSRLAWGASVLSNFFGLLTPMSHPFFSAVFCASWKKLPQRISLPQARP